MRTNQARVIHEDTVASGLRALARTRRAVALWTRVARGAWVLLAVVFAIILFDALWPMGDGMRCALAVALLTGMAWEGVRAGLGRTDGSRRVWVEAQRVERWFGMANNPLINALWLAPVAGGDNRVQGSGFGVQQEAQLTGVLAARSVAGGAQALAGVDPRQSIAWRGLRGQCLGLGVVALVWAGAAVAQPRLVGGGVTRLADPFGDHPPFSLTNVHIQLDPAQPRQGQDVLVTADFQGAPPAHAELVELDSSGRAMQRWAMHTAAATESVAVFEYKLLALREPMRVQVEWGSGRSQRVLITPQAAEKGTGNREQGTDNHTEPEPGTVQGAGNADPGAGNPRDIDALLRDVLAKVSNMADAARRLRALVTRLGAAAGKAEPGDQSLPPGTQEQIEQARGRINVQGVQAEALAQSLRDWLEANGDKLDPDVRDLLMRLSREMPNLKVPTLRGGMTGAGGQRLSLAELPAWLEKLAHAADSDMQDLDRDRTQLADVLGGRSSRGGSTPSGPIVNPDHVTPGAGHVGDTVGTGTSRDVTAALVQQAPASYRDLVSRYYERLARDAN